MNLTDSEIRAMKAGREMDAAIHGRVMGHCEHDWRVLKTLPGFDTMYYDMECSKCKAKFMNDHPWVPNTTPRYSGDITDAWDVVDIVIERYTQTFELEWRGTELGWFCYMGEPVHARTPQLAICQAALLAILETNDESSQ